jgi:hypothetical protein
LVADLGLLVLASELFLPEKDLFLPGEALPFSRSYVPAWMRTFPSI